MMEPSTSCKAEWWVEIRRLVKEKMDDWHGDDPLPIEAGGLPRVTAKVYKAQMDLDGTLE